MNDKILNLFTTFLIKTNNYDKFSKNVETLSNPNTHNLVHKQITINEHLNNSVQFPNRLISSGFKWSDSPEGYNYWNIVNINFEKYIINCLTK